MVRIDNPGLWMRRISQRLAEQAFGRSGIAQPREHAVDRSAGGIDGSVEVAPTPLDTNVGLIDTPGLMGWPEMTAQPRLQFRTVAPDPAPDCRMVRLQAAFAKQLFDIAERERVPQVPAHGAKNQLGSVCRHLKIAGRIAFFMISSGDPPPSAKVATQPVRQLVDPAALFGSLSRGGRLDETIDAEVVFVGVLKDGQALAAHVLLRGRDPPIGNGFHGLTMEHSFWYFI